MAEINFGAKSPFQADELGYPRALPGERVTKVGSIELPRHNPVLPKHTVTWDLGGGQTLAVFYGANPIASTCEIVFAPMIAKGGAYRLVFDIQSKQRLGDELIALGQRIKSL